jgi:hypothetical protein
MASFSQSSNGKGHKTFTFEIPLDERIVRTYCSQNQMETMTSKYSQRVMLTLLPPKIVKDGGEQSNKIWTLRAKGRHRQVIKNMAGDMIDRYNNIIKVIKNITKD